MNEDDDEGDLAPNPALNSQRSTTANKKALKNDGVRPGLVFGCIFVWMSITGGRFLAPFLEQEIGMSPRTIGVCLAAQSVITTLGGSIVGPLADQRESRLPGRGRTEILALGIMLGTICCLLHSLRHFSPSSSSIPFSHEQDNQPDEIGLGTMSSDIFSSTTFHFALRMMYAGSICCIFPVADAVALQYLEQHPQMSKDDYGRERMFGAIGWAVAHFGYAVLIDWYGFNVTYPLSLLGLVVALIAIHIYTRKQIELTKRSLMKRKSDIITANEGDDSPVESRTESTCMESEKQQLSTKSLVTTILGSFFGTYYSTAYMICLFLLSFGQVIVDALVFLFFETLESSYTMMGITVIFTVAFEIPIFQVAPTLLERSNAGVLLLVASFSYIVRVLGYASIPKGHIAYVLALEPLHGVTYACAQTSSVDTASRFSPPGWEATGQGLISLVRGSGSILGLLYGGWAVEHLGGRFMYEISSCLVSVGVLCLGVASCYQSPVAAVPSATSRSMRGKETQYLGVQLEEDVGDDGMSAGDTFVIDDSLDNSTSELELQPLDSAHNLSTKHDS
ncbi:hypothetical protein ACA910_004969 [Epithemia clementina (nom. ined.)]